MKQDITKEERLIIKFLLGQANQEEVKLLETWLKADEDNMSVFSDYQNIWNMDKIHQELTSDVEKKDWERLRMKMQSTQKPVMSIGTKKPVNLRKWLQVAAVFLVGFTLSWFVFSVFSIDNEETVVYNEITTPLGSNSTVNLPDGTEIVLNAGSKLRYPQKFEKQQREVFFEGEAFFNVSSDPNRRFIVHTSEVTVKVFGTRFNLKAYTSDKTVETTLVEGKISIVPNSLTGNRNHKEIVLKPNQRLVLNKEAGNKIGLPKDNSSKADNNRTLQAPKLIISKRVDPEYYTSWKDGRLIIKSERLDNLAIKLERKYNVHIHFKDDKVKQHRFTGIIEDETVEQVFDAIKTASNINFQIQDRDIWIGN